MNFQNTSTLNTHLTESNFVTVNRYDLYNNKGVSNTGQFKITTNGTLPSYFSSNMYHVIHSDEYFSMGILCFGSMNHAVASFINKSLKTKLFLQIIGTTSSLMSFGIMSNFMIKDYKFKPKVAVYYYNP